MLENLVGTKPKKKLMSVFLAFPKRGFTLEELAKSAEISKRAASEAVRELLKADALTQTARSRKQLFRANPRFPFSQELADLIRAEIKQSEDLVIKQLKKIPSAKAVILSGAFTYQPQLPTDLVIVGDSVSRPRLARTLAELEKLTGLPISYAVLPVAEYQYRQMMNDRFVRDVLDYPHVFVINLLRNNPRPK